MRDSRKLMVASLLVTRRGTAGAGWGPRIRLRRVCHSTEKSLVRSVGVSSS